MGGRCTVSKECRLVRVNYHRPYPRYKDSGVEWLGQVPVHWDVVRLKHLFFIINGGTPDSEIAEYWDGNIPWVTPDDLGDLVDPIIQSTRRYITEAGYQSCGTTLAPAGSLVLSTRAPIGHVAIAGVDLCTNQGCRCLVFRRPSVPKFFYFQLIAARPELVSWGQGSTFKELSRAKLGDVYLTVPPEPEQRWIATFLDRETAKIDALVEKKRRLIELLEERRSALITKAVTKGLTPNAPMKQSGVEWLGEIPDHWTVRRLRHVAVINPAPEVTTKLSPALDVSFVPMEAVGEWGGLKLESTRPLEEVRGSGYTYFCDGDVLVAKITPCFENGKGALAAGLVNGVGFGSTELHVIRPGPELDPAFLTYVTFSRPFRIVGQIEMKGAAGQQRVPEDFVKDFPVPLPPLSEQRAIAAFLDRETAKIGTLIAKVRQGIERLMEFRQALIFAAVTGKIDVRDEICAQSSY